MHTAVTASAAAAGAAAGPSGPAALEALSTEEEIVAFLRAQRLALREEWTPDGGGRLWMRRHTDLHDAVVRRLFTLAVERAARSGNGSSGVSGIAILAVGGYGRRALSPGSDLDITFLSERDAESPVLREMFRLVMDVLLSGARIKVGYAYRLLSDVEQGDIAAVLDHQTQTALLEARRIAGDASLLARFDRALRERLQIADFLFAKQAERREVRARAGDSAYVAEPNVKEGRGGLRDLETAAWMAQARFGRKGDALWRDLVRRKVITAAEMREVLEAREFLRATRNILHIVNGGEARDVLTASRQEEVAARFEAEEEVPPAPNNGGAGGEAEERAQQAAPPLHSGVSSGSPIIGGGGDFSSPPSSLIPHPSSPDAPPAVERFMRRYYRAAGQCDRVAAKVIARCLDAPIPLGTDTGLSSVRRAVTVTDPAKAEADPLWPWRALAFCQDYDLEISLAAEEAMERQTIRAAAAGDDALRREAGGWFLSLLSRPGDAYETVHQARRAGLLAQVLPELDSCMDLIAYDPAHAYTVGEHSLRVLRNLVYLRHAASSSGDSSDSGEGQFLADYHALFSALESPETLLLAALLHDIGKQWEQRRGVSGGSSSGSSSGSSDTADMGHAERGARKMPAICARLGCSPGMAADVEFLVRFHLAMAETAQLRDLGIPETIRDFARLVETPERLRMLYLLTYADTAAVGPGVWTEMKARLLGELFGRTEAAFAEMQEQRQAEETGQTAAAITSGGSSGAPSEDDLRARIRRQLTRSSNLREAARDEQRLSEEEVQAHTEAMPTAYLLNTPLEIIRLHLAMVERLRAEGGRPVVDLRTAAPGAGGHTELTIVARDDPQPGLLARIAGVLFAHDVRIHAAQVFTREDGSTEERLVIDTLHVDSRGGALPPSKRVYIEEALVRVLAGEQTLERLLSQRGRSDAAAALVSQRVGSLFVDDAVSPDRTLLDIQTPETSSALYRLAALISSIGWNIHAARVSAWGQASRCAFYVTDAGGRKVSADEARRCLQREAAGSAAGTAAEAASRQKRA